MSTTTTHTRARGDDTPAARSFAGTPRQPGGGTRVGIVPLPARVLLPTPITGVVATGKVPNDICVSIAILTVGGFSCAEAGKRLPFFRHIGAAAIFVTGIPSCLAVAGSRAEERRRAREVRRLPVPVHRSR